MTVHFIRRRKVVVMNRPYIIINCASSADGKISLPSRQQLRISSDEDMERVQMLREQCDAILVGIGTVLADDPKLTVKKPNAKQPLRIVLDSNGRTPDNAEVVNENANTLIFVRRGVKKKINRSNIDVVECEVDERGFIDLDQVMEELVKRGVKNLLVEGGSTVIWEFLKQGLFDEFNVYISPIVIGGRDTPTIADGEGVDSEKEIIRLKIESIKSIGEGLLIKYVPII